MNNHESANPPNTPSEPMTLEEARSVYWLRNNHRPLGELLDEGFLNEARLAWAVEKAYDPRLKQAAAVLLDWVKQTSQASQPQEAVASPQSDDEPGQTINAGITVEQAHATPWPFKPFKGQQMGELVDTRQLTLKDLGYAVENAWDERVRQAAIVLTALRLNQAVQEPAPSTGSLKVVSSGRSYAERRQLLLTLIQGIILGTALSFLIFLFVQWVRSRPGRPLAETLASPTGVIVFIIVIGLAIGVSWLFNRLVGLAIEGLDREIESYRKGQEGEDRVVEVMRQNLDGYWTLFRNVTLPGRNRADIDAILVGPPGVWALEIKAFTGEYRNIGEHWEVCAGNKWKLLKQSPSRQAQDNAVRLANFFRVDGIRQWVEPAVVWASPDGSVLVENPMIAIWTLDRLAEELGNIWQNKEMEEATRTRIIEKLTALCQVRDEEAS